jgi:hypothetical protein
MLARTATALTRERRSLTSYKGLLFNRTCAGYIAQMALDLVPLERRLHDLLQSLRVSKSDRDSWLGVQTTAEQIANTLRFRNAEGILLCSPV